MTMFGKRGSAVLEAPEESYALETEWAMPEPAPAGTLHQSHEEAPISPLPEHSFGSDPWLQQKGQYRLRVGVPGAMAGRMAMGLSAAFVLGLLGVSVFAARYSVLHDDKFFLTSPLDIEIEGSKHLTKPQIKGVFGADLHRNIFDVPLSVRQADLLRLPWTEHATVERLLPDRIHVQVTERTPVAFVRQGQQIGLVDDGGVLLDMPQDDAGNPHYSFPVLTGISSKDPLSTRAARMEIYGHFMQELDSTGEHFSQNLSEVDVSDPEDVKALVTGGSSDILVHFGNENFLKRYKLFKDHAEAWKTQYPKLAAVDTRYEDKMVLEMSAGTKAPLAEAKAPTAAAELKSTAKHAADKTVAHKQPPHSADAHGPVNR